MFAAQMDLAETVLCHAGGLQQHLVEWGVGSLGNFLECLWREIIGRGAETWLYLLACDVQLLGEDVKVHRNTGIIGLGGRIVRQCRRGKQGKRRCTGLYE